MTIPFAPPAIVYERRSGATSVQTVRTTVPKPAVSVSLYLTVSAL